MPKEAVGKDLEVTPAMIEAGVDAVRSLSADIYETTEPSLLRKILTDAFVVMRKASEDDGGLRSV